MRGSVLPSGSTPQRPSSFGPLHIGNQASPVRQVTRIERGKSESRDVGTGPQQWVWAVGASCALAAPMPYTLLPVAEVLTVPQGP